MAEGQPGGVLRKIAGDVSWADWSPSGEGLAIVHEIAPPGDYSTDTRISVLEFPIGKRLYTAAAGIAESVSRVLTQLNGHLSHPRFSPSGDKIAFAEHPAFDGFQGNVAVVDRLGNKTTLSAGWEYLRGLAWAPRGDEVWFVGRRQGGEDGIFGVTLSGRLRLLTPSHAPWPQSSLLVLGDVSRDGRVLVMNRKTHSGVAVGGSTMSAERVLVEQEDTLLPSDISTDGNTVLFSDVHYGYLQRTGIGSQPTRIGAGSPVALSLDQRHVIMQTASAQLALWTVGTTTLRPLANDGRTIAGAAWFPDGRHALLAVRADDDAILYVQDVGTGARRIVTPEHVSAGYEPVPLKISPDGQSIASTRRTRTSAFEREHRLKSFDWEVRIYSVHGGLGHTVPDSVKLAPLAWGVDGRTLYVRDDKGAQYQMDSVTGKRSPWAWPWSSGSVCRGTPFGPTGLVFAPGAGSYACGFVNVVSDLYELSNVR